MAHPDATDSASAKLIAHIHHAADNITNYENHRDADAMQRTTHAWCVRCMVEAFWSDAPNTIECRSRDGEPCERCTTISDWRTNFHYQPGTDFGCPCVTLPDGDLRTNWVRYIVGQKSPVALNRVGPPPPLTAECTC